MVKVKALQRVYYAGKEHAVGDEFEVTDNHALQLGVIRKVMKAETAAPQPDPTPAPDQLGRTKKPDSETQGERRTYKRRDQKAED